MFEKFSGYCNPPLQKGVRGARGIFWGLVAIKLLINPPFAKGEEVCVTSLVVK